MNVGWLLQETALKLIGRSWTEDDLLAIPRTEGLWKYLDAYDDDELGVVARFAPGDGLSARFLGARFREGHEVVKVSGPDLLEIDYAVVVAFRIAKENKRRTRA